MPDNNRKPPAAIGRRGFMIASNSGDSVQGRRYVPTGNPRC